jgi:hypothetical protein
MATFDDNSPATMYVTATDAGGPDARLLTLQQDERGEWFYFGMESSLRATPGGFVIDWWEDVSDVHDIYTASGDALPTNVAAWQRRANCRSRLLSIGTEYPPHMLAPPVISAEEFGATLYVMKEPYSANFYRHCRVTVRSGSGFDGELIEIRIGDDDAASPYATPIVLDVAAGAPLIVRARARYFDVPGHYNVESPEASIELR